MDSFFCPAELVTDHLLAVEVLLQQADESLTRGDIAIAAALMDQADQIVQAYR